MKIMSLLQCLPALKLATYNIRYAPLNSTILPPESPWSIRLPLILSQIDWENPDILGVQEALNHQYNDLIKSLKLIGYNGIGVGRDDGIRKGEFAPIFWKDDLFELVNHSYFWLSQTPEIPGSVGWDAAQARMVTLVELKPKVYQPTNPRFFQTPQTITSEKSFYVMNTHFDDQGEIARENSAKLILQRARNIINQTGKPLFLTGDLNSTPDDIAYRTLTTQQSKPNPIFTDSRRIVSHPFGAIGATYTGFHNLTDDRLVLDSVMTMGTSWKASKYGVIPNKFDESNYASDHRLVCAQFVPNPSARCVSVIL